MLHLIPQVKHLRIHDGVFTARTVCCRGPVLDGRVAAALERLPCDPAGAPLDMVIGGGDGEGYTLTLDTAAVHIRADGPAGAFYAIQTLRQVLTHAEIPCLTIEDAPDFPYRGFYHDVTRGKVPTLDTLKALVEEMAYYKLNSLQLYVEHTFPFAEYAEVLPRTGYLTPAEMEELDAYCRLHFIDFIPSLATFGHLFELLEQEPYRHLRVCGEETYPNRWHARMRHHTIDPRRAESLPLVESLMEQYAPHFSSDYFNICCDETFDLQHSGIGDVGRTYVDFVGGILRKARHLGKRVMMWADIVLEYPDTIGALPADTCFLNWDYGADPAEERIARLAALGRRQIVCPGTQTWSRLCENVAVEEQNICRMAEYGYRHGAEGVLNTNWGDWGNPCSLELAMYGLVLGAAKSWAVSTAVDEAWYAAVDRLLYGQTGAVAALKELSALHDTVSWWAFCSAYCARRYGGAPVVAGPVCADVPAAQEACARLCARLEGERWARDAYRREMLSAARGLWVMAELSADGAVHPTADGAAWLAEYSTRWLEKNKESELWRIQEMFAYMMG